MEEEIVETLDLSCGIGGSYGGKLVEGGVDGVLVVTVCALVCEEVVVFGQDGRFCEYRRGIGGGRGVWGRMVVYFCDFILACVRTPLTCPFSSTSCLSSSAMRLPWWSLDPLGLRRQGKSSA